MNGDAHEALPGSQDQAARHKGREADVSPLMMV